MSHQLFLGVELRLGQPITHMVLVINSPLELEACQTRLQNASHHIPFGIEAIEKSMP